MQLNFDQKDLSQASSVVAALLKRASTTLPVLSNLLIDAQDDHAIFLGTDLESMVRVRIPGKTAGGPGKLTLPADKLAELVGLLPAGSSVQIEDLGGQVRVISDTNDYKLVTLPADDYPKWQPETALTRFHLTQKQLKSLIDAVSYAVPAKDHRRVLMGILLELREGTLRATATDGKKLSRMTVPVADIEGEETGRVIVAGKLMDDIRRILGNEGSVDVEIGQRQVAFKIDNVEFRTNGIDGKYPDCDAVIPRDFPVGVRLNRDSFQAGARRAGVVSDDKSKSIILKLEDNLCHFSSMAADIGTFTGDTQVEYDGPAIEVAFNYQMLIETLNSFSHPDIHLNIKSSQAPCLFKCDEEPDHLCVLMPIKLADIRPRADHDDGGQ
ncbi:DNA polymerase III subunit beta [bacterium]|nr:DNA polymerase III subunit beta [bacterium]